MAENIECSARNCYRAVDEPMCDRHIDEIKEAVRDESRTQVEEAMGHWESVTSIDNPITVAEIKKELLRAIKN